MTRFSVAFAITLVSLSCGSNAPEAGLDRADDESANQAFDELAALLTPEAIVNAEAQKFAESEIKVRQKHVDLIEPGTGKLLFQIITAHAKDDEFGSSNFAEALGSSNLTKLVAGDSACDEVKDVLLGWLSDEGDLRKRVSEALESKDIGLTFCAKFELAGSDKFSEFVFLSNRLIDRTLIVEAFGIN